MREPHPRSWLIRYVIGVFSLLLCSVLTKFSVEGKKNLPPSGPYILAPNHIDDVDPAPITAAVVNYAEKKNKKLDQLSINELRNIEPKLTIDVLKIFDLKNSVNSKKSYGGTSFDNIKKMIMKYKKV